MHEENQESREEYFEEGRPKEVFKDEEDEKGTNKVPANSRASGGSNGMEASECIRRR